MLIGKDWIDMFQSAPLTEARGDLKDADSNLSIYEFQSAPLTEARGDRAIMLFASARLICFNPLPSPKQGETSFGLATSPNQDKFQSAPLTEARGDILW